MAASAHRRTSDRTVELRGPALDTVLQMAASPYDLHHPHHEAAAFVFAPATAYIKVLGMLTRAYLDPRGWVRDAAFEIRVSAMTIESEEPSALDTLEQLIGRLSERDIEPTYLFHYLERNDAGDLAFDPAAATAADRDRVAVLLDHDVFGPDGQRILERHKASIDEAFATFLAGRLDRRLRVTEVHYAIDLLGFTYDAGLSDRYRRHRPDEVPDVASLRPRGIRGFLSLRSGASAVSLTPFTPVAESDGDDLQPHRTAALADSESESGPAIDVDLRPLRTSPPITPATGWDPSDELRARDVPIELDFQSMLDDLDEAAEPAVVSPDDHEPGDIAWTRTPAPSEPRSPTDELAADIDAYLDEVMAEAEPADDVLSLDPFVSVAAARTLERADRDPLSFLDDPALKVIQTYDGT